MSMQQLGMLKKLAGSSCCR